MPECPHTFTSRGPHGLVLRTTLFVLPAQGCNLLVTLQIYEVGGQWAGHVQRPSGMRPTVIEVIKC